MKTLTRLAIICGSAGLAMTLAGPALAAYVPKLDVSVPKLWCGRKDEDPLSNCTD